jgi:hypothetical protein
VVIGTDFIGNCESKYHMTTTALSAYIIFLLKKKSISFCKTHNISYYSLKVALNTKTHNPDFDNNKKYFEKLAISGYSIR